MNQLLEQTPTVAIDQKEDTAPRQVFLFSGHMVDAPDRSLPRFPPDKEPLAAAAIGTLLDELGAGATDVAISSGACGGDLLFAESCLQRNLRVEIYLPFIQEEFLKKSINFAGEHWRQKFFWVKERVRRWHIMPQELGPTPTSEDSFACVNLWMLDQALDYGTRKVSFICLWDRQAGDGTRRDEAFTRRRRRGLRQGLCARYDKTLVSPRNHRTETEINNLLTSNRLDLLWYVVY